MAINDLERFLGSGIPVHWFRARTGGILFPVPLHPWFAQVTAQLLGAKVVTHARYVIFQMAEVAVPQWLFRAILEGIQRLRLREPVPI